MTRPDRMDLLKRMVAQHGQANVARRIGKSAAAICQILSGDYKASPDAILDLVEEAFGQTTVHCPLLGEIPLKKCSDNRNRPLIATNPLRVKIWRACKECDPSELRNNGGGK
ncbi:helix-turn-helix transcriptional regulator [Geobacter pelophilus]|uniref:Helix-turn-helix transcriptional regulator n=1 Tax=Geoanaerobacter pelophilus TaxID=60036 RepID=A0AAW4L891_9BACT|nr:helix-turn-helix transcriptional regulator [Geoanaerobacter pelophilus]MBT0666377.1 helix-turn-helix transcriptional regulator [Geoanaerobacter pelophilus]